MAGAEGGAATLWRLRRRDAPLMLAACTHAHIRIPLVPISRPSTRHPLSRSLSSALPPALPLARRRRVRNTRTRAMRVRDSISHTRTRATPVFRHRCPKPPCVYGHSMQTPGSGRDSTTGEEGRADDVRCAPEAELESVLDFGAERRGHSSLSDSRVWHVSSRPESPPFGPYSDRKFIAMRARARAWEDREDGRTDCC